MNCNSLALLFISLMLWGCSISPYLDKSNPEYQMLQGIGYDHGSKNRAPDKVKAASWYRRAAEQGYSPAQNSLASMYQAGNGVPKDFSQAVYWYQKAADQNNQQAQTNLGYMYDKGLGVSKDQARAVQLYLSAAESGYVDAMIDLGLSYQAGDGVQRDNIRAYMWLDLARYYIGNGAYTHDRQLPIEALEKLKKEMTEEQVAEAEKLTNQWAIAHRKSK